LYQYAENSLRYFKHDLKIAVTFPVKGEFGVVAIDRNGVKHGIGTRIIDSANEQQVFTYLIDGAPIKRFVFNFKASRPLRSDEVLEVSGFNINAPYAKNISSQGVDIENRIVGGKSVIQTNGTMFSVENGSDSILLLTTDINRESGWVSYFLPIVVSALVFLLFNQFSWSTFPAFADLKQGQLMPSKAEFDTLNGLRGVSALLVLLAHSGPSGYFNLQLGLALLFLISGFLLCKPFVEDRERIFQRKRLSQFWRKRILRILPMYYFAVTLTFVSDASVHDMLLHYLLLEAKGHFWAIPQIFFFYLVLPIVLVITSILARYHIVLVLVVLGVSIGLHLPNYLLPHHMFYNGHYFTHFYAAQFLLGVFISYLYYGLIANSELWDKVKDKFAWLLAVLGYLLLIGFILVFGPVFETPSALKFISTSFLSKSIIAALIILAFVMLSHTANHKLGFLISNPIFRSIGVVGFSFYLLHGLGIELIENYETSVINQDESSRWSYGFFLKAGLLTYLMSLVTYSYIERPFFGKKIKSPVRY
jgi:peptidoglycan/LPS O-acetylase OafA/YrhL